MTTYLKKLARAVAALGAAAAARVLRALFVVIHDPDVQRSGKQFAAKIAARLIITVGGATFYAQHADLIARVIERLVG